jgi:cation transport ATPase
VHPAYKQEFDKNPDAFLNVATPAALMICVREGAEAGKLICCAEILERA